MTQIVELNKINTYRTPDAVKSATHFKGKPLPRIRMTTGHHDGNAEKEAVSREKKDHIPNRSGGDFRLKKVVIRGVEYESGKDAAKALGVTNSCVTHHRRRGTLDRCGVGIGHRPLKTVVIRGVEYESISAAAKAFGLNPSTVSYHKKRNTLHLCGLGHPCGAGKSKVKK